MSKWTDHVWKLAMQYYHNDKPGFDRECQELLDAYAEAEKPPDVPAGVDQVRPIDGKFGVKEGKIVNLVSGQEIPKDEPLFLLRARDHHAIATLSKYLDFARFDCNDLHLAGIQQVIDRFQNFRREHPELMKQPGITRHLKLEAHAQTPSTSGVEGKP